MNAKRLSVKGSSLFPRISLLLTMVLLALAAALAVVAANTPAISRPATPALLQSTGNYGGDVRFPVVEPNSLDPADPNTEWAIVSQIFEGLTKWGDNHEPLPGLAESFYSPELQHWIWLLRDDARFHNGRRVTAQDVVYSWQRVAGEGNGWYDATVAPLLSSVTAVSSDTLQVVLNEPFAAFPTLLALPFMSVVPSETVGTIYTDPVGSGPFQFSSWTPGDSIILEHNDDYYGGRPYLGSITYQFYASEDEMYQDFVQGGLDLSPVPDDHLDEISSAPNAIYPGGHRLYYYGMKVDVPPFDDVRVRQALNHAVHLSDLADLLDVLYAAEGPIPPGLQGYDPPVPAYEYNPMLALDLLAQAGWTDTNADSVLDDGAGTDLTIELWHPTDDRDAAIAAAVADDWRDIGSTGLGAAVVVNDTDWATYRDHYDEYPMYRLGWHPDYPAPLSFMKPLFRSDSSQNHAHYNNPQVDAWLEEAAATLDLTARQEVYRQIETRVQEDAPFLNLFYFGTAQSYSGAFIKDEDVLGLVIPSWGLEAIQMEQVQLLLHDHDVMVQEILLPKESVLATEPITPVIKIRNAGRNDEFDVLVRCRILQDSTEVYNDTVLIASWARNSWGNSIETVRVYWVSLPADNYSIECATLLPGDEDPSNDMKTRDFVVSEDAFYDAYIRDHKYDDGSVCTTQSWGSPDIWVRHEPDGIARHQDPILGQENYVYVRVRNTGNAPIGDGTLEIYYHDPSAGVRCGNWVQLGYIYDPEDNILTYVDYYAAWVPPIEGHTCLFARFSSPDDPVSAECEVACDNNIAQRNVNVIELEDTATGKRTAADIGQISVVFEVSNLYDLPAPVDLIVERGTFPPTGTLELEFSRDLFSRWQDAGGGIEGGAVIPNTTRISLTHPVSTTVFSLPLGVRETQQARMLLSGPPAAEFELHVSERIHGRVVGGMTYHTPLPWLGYLPLVFKEYDGFSGAVKE